MLWVRPFALRFDLHLERGVPAGRSEASMRSSKVAPDTMRSARVMKSAKNFSSR